MKFEKLFYLYYEKHAKLRTRCPSNTYYFYTAHGAKWADREVATIARGEVQEWVDDLGVGSKSSATRAVNTLSAIINWGVRREYVIVTANPCVGVERFAIKSRERFLMPDELERFKSALEHEKPQLRDFFWLCLLTGARRGNVQAMRWIEVDAKLCIWQFSQKNGDTQVCPLTTAALAILDRRSSVKSEWVFPSRGSTGHLIEPKRAWSRILKRASLNNLRIHDLRRTLGSYLAIDGCSTLIIGKALGHKDQRSTAIYARLDLDPVRNALQNAQNRFTDSD